MNNFSLKPLSTVEVISSLEYERPKISGLTTPSGYVFFDNSTLDIARTCLRKYYFQKIRGWNVDGPAAPLIFGSSWHSAMDFLWPACSKGEKKSFVIDGAFSSFLETWNASEYGNYSDLDLLDLYPRTPTRALEMLEAYYKEYGESFKKYKILSIERPFIIPLTDDSSKLMYIGKLDKEIEDERTEEVTICDHKTSSFLETQWINTFSPSDQFDGYHHAGKMHWGRKFTSIMVDGAQVHKTKISFKRLPLMRQTSQIESWLWETLETISEIQYNEELLLNYRNSGKHLEFLPAFKGNHKVCAYQYGKPCPFRDLCIYQNNPEDHDISDGFKNDIWNPFLIEEKITKEGMEFNVVVKDGE